MKLMVLDVVSGTLRFGVIELALPACGWASVSALSAILKVEEDGDRG